MSLWERVVQVLLFFYYYSWLQRRIFTEQNNMKHGSWSHTKGLKNWCFILHSAGHMYPSLTSLPKSWKRRKIATWIDFLNSYFWWDGAPHNTILYVSALPRASPCTTNIFCSLKHRQHSNLMYCMEEKFIDLNSNETEHSTDNNKNIAESGSRQGLS